MQEPSPVHAEAGAAAIKSAFNRAPTGGNGAERGVTSMPRPGAAPRSGSIDVAMDDWDDLFRAVKVRLRQTVAERAGKAGAPEMIETLSRIRAGVLECVEALDQLHSTLRHETDRRRYLDESGGGWAYAADLP